jgi:hypothetical protein
MQVLGIIFHVINRFVRRVREWDRSCNTWCSTGFAKFRVIAIASMTELQLPTHTGDVVSITVPNESKITVTTTKRKIAARIDTPHLEAAALSKKWAASW